ncbi:MAG: FHA domain-containing protein [Acidimicrobiales bacterium]
MSDAVLTLLKFALLGGLYLFFAWVLWSAFAQMRAPAPASVGSVAPARSSTRGPLGQIFVLEPPEMSGAVLSVGDELTIGRAAACTLTLDDTYVSQQHASIVRRDRQHFVEDLGSTNGTFVNRERIVGSVVLRVGDRVQIGSTVMEFS